MNFNSSSFSSSSAPVLKRKVVDLQNVESGVTEKVRWSSWIIGRLPKTFNAVMSIEEAKAA